MKNDKELTAELAKLYGEIKEGKVELDVAAALTNTAGKIIASVNMGLKAADLSKEKPNIPFLK